MFVVFSAYLALHFALYSAIFRHFSAFQRERTIFFYHAGPALAAGACGIIALVLSPDGETLARMAIVCGIQGIYSLSFLELWTLSQIGYSLAILTAIEEAERTGTVPDLSSLERTGEEKKSGRVQGLSRTGLIAADGPALRLTGVGRLVAGALAGLARLINLQRAG